MSEELALDQVGRDRRAIDGHQRFVGAVAGAVDRTRDQFLARAGLAGDQHRRVGFRHLLDGAEHRLHAVAAADEIAVARHFPDRFAEVFRLLRQQLDLPLRFQALIRVPENQGVEHLPVILEPRERRLGRKDGMIPAPGDEVLRHP